MRLDLSCFLAGVIVTGRGKEAVRGGGGWQDVRGSGFI